MNKPNFKKVKEEAYKTLLLQENFIFPVNPKEIILKEYNIYITSFQDYSKKTNISINDLTSNGTITDGYTYKDKDKKNIIIFYNEDIESEGRKIWTISHELGHIVLNHDIQCEINEQEANFFASQLLAPQCVLREMLKNGVKLTSQYLSHKFKISKEASENCISTLNKVIENNQILTEYDDIIISLFKPYIYTDYSNESFFDDLDNLRNNFY